MDYNTYIGLHEVIVQQPQSWTVLMRNGYLWRIFVKTVSFNEVLEGPTGWNPIPRTMIVARDDRTDELFVDDNLTDIIKMSLLFGTYMCSTG